MKVRHIKRRLNKEPSPMQNRYSRRARRWVKYMTFEQAEKLVAAIKRHAAGDRS